MFWPFLSPILPRVAPEAGIRGVNLRRRLIKWVILAVILTLVTAAAALAIQEVTKYQEAYSTQTEVAIPSGAVAVAPETPVWLVVPTTGRQVTAVNLFVSHRDFTASIQRAEPVWQDEVALPVVIRTEDARPDQGVSKFSVLTDTMSSPLLADARYRLVIEGSRLNVKFPMPEWEPWREEYTFQTMLSPVPLDVQPAYDLRAGEPITIRWSMPIANATCSTEPSVESVCTVDPEDGHLMHVSLTDYSQGESYRLTVADVTGGNGIPWPDTQSIIVNTPEAVSVADVGPEHGSFGLDPDQTISITFSDEILDRAAVEQAVMFDPSVPGHFEWSDDGKTMIFYPESGFPWETDVIVRVPSGMAVRGVSGGYLDQNVEWSFGIRPNKVIDVDLSRQLLTAYEDGEVVMTSLTGTGVRGAETPTGTYMVVGRYETLRMRGVNPSGTYYDIPDVPWVLHYWGDYTIHGSYWRSSFGFPQSNGCVSLPVPFSRELFYWAPIGTRIVIHY